jgi:ATP-dependent DNA helicase RecG
MRAAVEDALRRGGDRVEDELPDALRRKRVLPVKAEALREVHFPTSLERARDAHRRLAYDELLSLQLEPARSAARRRSLQRRVESLPAELDAKIRKALPFELTDDQEAVIAEIRADLERPHPMARLLQGEVGSGKTLTAFLAAAPLIEAGSQVAFMAPTELLARQHADNAARLLEPLGVRVGLLSGGLAETNRTELLSRIGGGQVDLIVGTHALFSRDVAFARLRLVIVDEQQRFGVDQRARLAAKTADPDMLMMTATPIPRTLALTLFGDIDVSTIRTMPKGRKQVETHLARLGNEQKVYDFVKKELSRGRQAYFVYPLIAESDRSELRAAESMYERLAAEVFAGFKLGLIHSRVAEQEKNETMEAFRDGKVDILVATSVVEVGVDVSNATCMVIEHAERFGLSALHQLRGRVGRGSEQSYCFLVYDPNLTETGKERMRVMHAEHDGFAIAEKDLQIRGPGDLRGVEQSGYLRLNFADLAQDTDILLAAREDAFELVEADAGLIEPAHALLRRAISLQSAQTPRPNAEGGEESGQ